MGLMFSLKAGLSHPSGAPLGALLGLQGRGVTETKQSSDHIISILPCHKSGNCICTVPPSTMTEHLALASYFLSRNLSLLVAQQEFLPYFFPFQHGADLPQERLSYFFCSFILTLWTGQCASSTWLIYMRQWWWKQAELPMELLAADVRNNHTCFCSRGQNWNGNNIFSRPFFFVPSLCCRIGFWSLEALVKQERARKKREGRREEEREKEKQRQRERFREKKWNFSPRH